MTLSDLSIRRPVFAWMIMFGLIVFGAISFGRLGVSLMPSVDFPILEINVRWEGAAPELLEAELIDPIEQKVIAVEGLKEVRSTVRQGGGSIELEFELDRDVDAAVQEVQAVLSQIRYPLGVDTPTLRKSSTDSDPIVWIGVAGDMPLREMVAFVDGFLIDQFQILPGVGEVSIQGSSERNLRIWVDNEKLRQYELTVLDVQEAVAREHAEVAAGYIENQSQEINVRTMGEGITPEQVANILITRRGGQTIYDSTLRIGDVARVEDGLNDVRRIARINGREAVGMAIRKQRGANEVEIGRAVRAKIEELNRSGALPKGMELSINVDFTTFVERSVKQTEEELLFAGLLTALIVYLFLGNWSSAINIILAIPTSVVGTFTILYFMGFTLNTFTLLALALAIGIVVDDAIMVLENIVRHFHMGKPRVNAAREGAREITFAAVAATLAVIAIFLPVAFMSGIIGRFFFQFGVTITAAVALSLLEAITLTPMRCSQFLQSSERPGWIERTMRRGMGSLAERYRAVLGVALRWRWAVLIVSAALFGWSLALGAGLRREFVPPQDQNFIRTSVQMPVDSSITRTDAEARRVEEYLRTRPEVARIFTGVGGFSGTPNQFNVMITLVDKKDRKLSQRQLVEQFRKDLGGSPGIRMSFQDISTRGLTPRRSQPVEFNLRGPDYAVLDAKSREIMAKMEAGGLMVDVNNNYRAGMPELRIQPDREAASARGVSMLDLARTVNAAIGGVREGKFTKDGRRYDVRIRLNPDQRVNADDVDRLQVRNQYGELVPVRDLVKLETVPTVQSISRVNRQRAISITANLSTGASQADALAAVQRICRDVLPAGYAAFLEGGAKTFQESFRGLNFVFLLGLIVAYMVLASQFNSFVHPFTILLALPFSISGAVFALLASDQSLNLYSAIGVILLMGIAKKNSILLVEFANKFRYEDGLPAVEAVHRAAPIRLRPILMTSVATVGAALPLALGIGPGAETRMPMAIAVIGGIVVSTLFTLFVVPCAYTLMARLEHHTPTPTGELEPEVETGSRRG